MASPQKVPEMRQVLRGRTVQWLVQVEHVLLTRVPFCWHKKGTGVGFNSLQPSIVSLADPQNPTPRSRCPDPSQVPLKSMGVTGVRPFALTAEIAWSMLIFCIFCAGSVVYMLCTWSRKGERSVRKTNNRWRSSMPPLETRILFVL